MALLLVGLLAATAGAQAAFEWPPLLPVAQGGRVVPYVEERFLRFLTEPLRSEGTLAVDTAGRLIKATTAPAPERLIVEGQGVVVERPPGRTIARISLRADPAAEATISAIRALVNADRKALSAEFRVQVDGAAEAWTLSLVPMREALREAVEAIVVSGRQGDFTTLEVRQANGDRIVLSLGER